MKENIILHNFHRKTYNQKELRLVFLSVDDSKKKKKKLLNYLYSLVTHKINFNLLRLPSLKG